MADKEMKVVFERPHALLPVVTNYCPGCSHGIVNRLVAECLDELDVEGSTVGIAPVGCTVTSYDFYGCDMIEAAHGREARAARRRRVRLPGRRRPGVHRHGRDGSCGHARREHHRRIREQRHLRHDRRPNGSHEPAEPGDPDLSLRPQHRDGRLPYPRVLERVTVDCPKNVRKAKKAIKKAFQTQIDKRGYSLVEIVGTCPTNWGMTPQDAFAWMNENMLPYYPLGVYKDVVAEGYANAAEAASARNAACPIAHPDPQVEGGAR